MNTNRQAKVCAPILSLYANDAPTSFAYTDKKIQNSHTDLNCMQTITMNVL